MELVNKKKERWIEEWRGKEWEEDEWVLVQARSILKKRNKGLKLGNLEEVLKHVRNLLSLSHIEKVFVFYLNTKSHLLGTDVFIGEVQSCSFHPARILRGVIKYGSTRIIMAHNHPSGNSTPSKEDRKITSAVKKLLQVMDVELDDHIIIPAGDPHLFYSFRKEGLI